MTETAVLTLTDFLLARLAEDEATARGHEGTAYLRWQFVKHRTKAGGYIAGGVADDWHNGAYVPVSEHIARHDPARVLADVEAKRYAIETMEVDGWDFFRAMASVYRDHPDYNPEWTY